MPDYTVKADVDTMLRANDKAAIRSAIGVGTTDVPTFAGVTMASSTSLLSHSAGAGVYDSRVNLKLLVDNAAFSNNLSFRYAGGTMVQVWAGQTPAGVASFSGEGFNVVNKLGFSTVATNAPIVVLEQDAPGILAQRNGTAKQALRVYNTNLSGAPEWAEFDWITSGIGNTLRIGTNLSGNGAARPIDFVVGGVVRMSIGSAIASVPGSFNAAGYSVTGSSIAALGHNGVSISLGSNVWATQHEGTLLRFNGATSAFPAIKRVATGIHIVSADDSAFAPLTAGGITSATYITVGSSNILGWGTGSGLFGNATSGAGTGALRFLFGGTSSQVNWGGDTNSFPAIKRNGAGIDIVLANDSGFAPLAAANLDLPASAAASAVQQLTVGRIVYAGEGYRVGNNFQVVFSNGADYARGIGVSASGGLSITNGTTGGQSLQFVEMTAPAAPATNGVRLYAEDNGAGKTRIMALFATGVAQQIAIEP